MRRCSIEGCGDQARRRGWCNKHYERWRRHGDPKVIIRDFLSSDVQRFWRKVEKSGDCWLWTAAVDRGGYGRYKTRDRGTMFAHRFAYTEFVGEIPVGLEIDHLCRTRLCVNPAHLEPVTHAENVRRAVPFRNQGALRV